MRREERQRREEEEMMRLQEEEMLRLQEEEMRRRMALEEPEPVPMSRRTVSQGQERMVTPPEEAPPPPLEEMEPPPVAPVRASPGRPATTRRGQAKQANREPSVGADRYEDIIVEVRKRSLSRGPNSRMGSRTSSTVDFRTSQAELPSNSGSKVDIAGLRSSIGGSSRSVAGVDLDSKPPVQPSPPPKPRPTEVFKPPAPAPPQAPQVMAAKPPAAPLALDANSNSTAPTLPTVPKASKPVEPDPLVQMFPKNIPHWFVITYTYSVVLIVILLIANSTPDGKLYIHFTAFWSLVIYFTLEDEQTTDLLDTMVEGYFLIANSTP